VIPILQTPHHTKLRILTPCHAVQAAPLGHGPVSLMGKRIAGLLVGVEALESVLLPHGREHLKNVSMADLHSAGHLLKRRVYVANRFTNKGKVL
jgi:hypothetical protein